MIQIEFPERLRDVAYVTTPNFDTGSQFNTYTSGRLTAIQYATTNEVNASEVAVPYTFTEMFAYNQAPAIATKRLRPAETITYPTGGNPPYTQATVSGDLNTNYTYDTEGHVTSTGYPATVFDGPGATYSYQFDSQKRPTGMTDQNNNSMVSSAAWGPANELDSISYLGYTETRGYNSMFQLTSIKGNTYSYPAGTNIGKISSQVIGGETVQYTYDTLNRLASATGSGWSQTFVYDGFGNLTNRIPTGTAPSSPATPADPATNRLSGYSYDANGNLITVGYAYDAENRLISAVSGSVQYLYDSQNKRIWQGNYATDFNGVLYLRSEQVFVYGVDGKKLGAYNPTVQYGGINGQIPQSIVFNASYSATTNLYFGGRLIKQGGTTVAPDRLGSIGRYFPYGEERNYPTLPNDQVKFATYTRDSATGLDYADQRYYSSALGRFLTPDPYRATGASVNNPSDPGSWNKYVYTRGDPVNRTDRWGTCDEDEDGSCWEPPDWPDPGRRPPACAGVLGEDGAGCGEGGGLVHPDNHQAEQERTKLRQGLKNPPADRGLHRSQVPLVPTERRPRPGSVRERPAGQQPACCWKLLGE